MRHNALLTDHLWRVLQLVRLCLLLSIDREVLHLDVLSLIRQVGLLTTLGSVRRSDGLVLEAWRGRVADELVLHLRRVCRLSWRCAHSIRPYQWLLKRLLLHRCIRWLLSDLRLLSRRRTLLLHQQAGLLVEKVVLYYHWLLLWFWLRLIHRGVPHSREALSDEAWVLSHQRIGADLLVLHGGPTTHASAALTEIKSIVHGVLGLYERLLLFKASDSWLLSYLLWVVVGGWRLWDAVKIGAKHDRRASFDMTQI